MRMRFRWRCAAPWRAAGLTLSIACLPFSVAAQQGEPAAFTYARDPTAVVVRYRELLGEIADADRGPTLTIFGDGRAAVHYPRYMKRAGEHELRLSRAKLDALVETLVSSRLMDFDAEAAHARKRELEALRRAAARERGEPELFDVHDASSIEIELRLDSYRPPGATAADTRRNVEKRIAWRGLRPDARRYPEHTAIQGLAAADRELRELMEGVGAGGSP